MGDFFNELLVRRVGRVCLSAPLGVSDGHRRGASRTTRPTCGAMAAGERKAVNHGAFSPIRNISTGDV
jgi:hypothetical protein